MRRTTALGLGLVLLLAGCGADNTVEVVTAEASQQAATDCGDHEIGQNERLNTPAATCLLDAVKADEQAILKITFLTTEGDPIKQVYRHLGAGEVQVVTDTTEDKFGPNEVRTETCTGLVRSSFAFTFSACT
ncbi:hypothetical protein Kisp01_27260 [Kineosporia sp. NBRC 101677]|uniref:DUF4362 domain-containing protein n=1 Tax=Kineosporia sp. NBRC 101677 TaxID=3032197 RepID=UPI0024A294E0|nr:DUF4362 domain-containing protein [Kineosporia sp. NBRC 101677]GLY15711.1 hypothetical protein Kisp01_27260 [Kineosporia sp. NBRC 101677]